MNPDTYTLSEHFISVGDGHELYVQDWGNKKARTPIVFLHGGPGSSVQDKHRSVFDPKKQRVVFFDQRGCGPSLPYASREHNTTDDLVEDILKITKALKIDRFVLHGGSWGSTLALAFGIKHPTKVVGMVLHGIFTGSHAEVTWLSQGQFRSFYPDVWDRYLAATPRGHQADPSAYHFKRALGKDPNAAKASSFAYECVEGGVMQLDDRHRSEDFENYDPSGIQMEIFYLVNNCFLPDGYILKNASRLTMPVHLVQGRYDIVCPPRTAYELAKALPKGQLIWTQNGHKAEHESWTVQKLLLEQLT